jgi:hypothetical protein
VSQSGDGGGGGRSTSLLRLVGGGTRLRVDTLGLKVFMDTGGRRPWVGGLDCPEGFIKGQLDRGSGDVEVVNIVGCQTFSIADRASTGGGGMVEGAKADVI